MSDHTFLTVVSIVLAGLTMAIGAFGAAFGESRIAAAGLDAKGIVAKALSALGEIEDTRSSLIA